MASWSRVAVRTAAVLIVACLPAVAAGAPSAADKEQAEKAYEEAKDLYKRGQYRAAVQRLTDARALDPGAKELPYNLGLVHEKLGEVDEAIRWFELYLTLEKDEGERERVRSTIKRLEGARDELRAKQAAAAAASGSSEPPPPPPPPPPKKGRMDALVYATGGASLVALAAGTYLGLTAMSERPKNPTTGQGKSASDLQDDADAAHRKAVMADVAFAVAVLAGGASAYLYFGRDAAPSPTVGAALVPQPGGVAGSVRVVF